MRAGTLRHRITLERRTDATGTAGGVKAVWDPVPFAVAWAEVTPLQGRELEAARGMQSEATHRVRLRYLAGVTPKLRVNFGGRLMDIEDVVDVGERHRELVLRCIEGRRHGA